MAVEVFFWGSNPYAEYSNNDDCFGSVSFETLEEAQQFIFNPHDSQDPRHQKLLVSAVYLQAEFGLGRAIRTAAEIAQMNAQKAQEEERFERAYMQEMAVQAGMMGGVHAFNEVMGFDSLEHCEDYFY
jgi:hypothetical protein